uniref:Uncharacterized protein n=1 Tax=Arundo donax TaxID=35708 RepID=A0A0A9CYU1_ARUDO
MFDGGIPSLSSVSTLPTIVEVFPLPGPATIISGTDTSLHAASLCLSFRECKYS